MKLLTSMFRNELTNLFTELLEAAVGMEHSAETRLASQEEALATAQEEEDRYVEQHVLNWFTEALPRVLRYSSVVATFTAIEFSLAAVCHELQRQKGFSLAVGDLKGSGSEQSRSYLTKVAGIDLDDLNGIWQQLKDWQRVRNCIVHTNGEIGRANDAAKLQEAIVRLEGLNSESNEWSLGGEIRIEAGACERLIRLGKSFVEAVMEKSFGPDPFGNIVIEEVMWRLS